MKISLPKSQVGNKTIAYSELKLLAKDANGVHYEYAIGKSRHLGNNSTAAGFCYLILAGTDTSNGEEGMKDAKELVGVNFIHEIPYRETSIVPSGSEVYTFSLVRKSSTGGVTISFSRSSMSGAVTVTVDKTSVLNVIQLSPATG